MLTLQELIKKYLDNCTYMKGLSDKSIKAYSIDLRQFADNLSAEPDWVKKENIENYIKLLYQKYMPRTAKRKVACIKAFFRYLEIEEILEPNPFHKIKIKRREAMVLPKTVPINVVTRILNKIYSVASEEGHSDYFYKNTVRDAAVMELLFASGVRVGELCTLLPDDIDLRSRVIKVHGKGSKERYIQITNKNVQIALKNYRKLFADEIKKSGYYFVNNRGNRLSEQSARLMVGKYAGLVGSDIHITPHMFRHTIATLLLEEDVDIRYIQELLGHSSIITTQIYTHISMSAQKRILTKKHPRNKMRVVSE